MRGRFRASGSGEHTRDRRVLVGRLAEILRDQRPTHKVAAMFIGMAFGSPIYEIYERLRALRFNNVFETNFGLVHTPDGALALTFAQPVAPAEVEEPDEDEEFGRYTDSSRSGWMR